MLMVLKNTETGEESITRDMLFRERDHRNDVLNMVPYVWEEVTK